MQKINNFWISRGRQTKQNIWIGGKHLGKRLNNFGARRSFLASLDST